MPLPKPNTDETRNEFVSRCMLDPNIRNDFDSIEQRVAVCNNLYTENKEEKLLKSFTDDYEKVLTRAERKSISDFTKYYLSEYEKSIPVIQTIGLNQANIIQFFKLNELSRMYVGLYSDVGLKMAKWYESKYKKVYTKADEAQLTQWEEQFATEGSLQASIKASMVQDTARKTMFSIVAKLSTDEMYISSGAEVQARMLRNQFRRYSKYQALRVVRTESNYVANIANYTTAQTIFPANQLKKKWISGLDARVRPTHQEANGQIVLATDKFIVGGKRMSLPGDPAGGAKEVINCRCSTIMIPIENAQTVGEISDISFGLAREIATTETTTSLADIVVNNAIREEVITSNIIKPNGWDEITNDFGKFDDSYLSMLSEKITINKFSGRSFASVDGKNISLNTSRYKYAEGKHSVLAHEVGHSIHLQRGWITPYSEIKGTTNKLIKDTFDKYLKKYGFRDRVKTQEISKKLNELGWFARTGNYKNIKEFADLTQEQYINYLGGYADTVEALTKGQAGWGHGKTYYSRFSGSYRYMEFFAHSMENTFVGNPVFKYYDPDLYNDMINMIKELQKIPK